jgi:tetratricopeptide (TPR) repeat protein
MKFRIKKSRPKDLNHILTFAPDNIFAKTGLANLKKNNGELDDALKDYNKLIAEKPESLLYSGRADVYLRMKKIRKRLQMSIKQFLLIRSLPRHL